MSAVVVGLMARIAELEQIVAEMDAEIVRLKAVIQAVNKATTLGDIKKPIEPPILYGVDIGYAGDADVIETDEQTFTRLVEKMGGKAG